MTTVTREIPAENREHAIRSLVRLLDNFLPGKPLEVTVERKKRERTDLQNRALWGCAYKALREQSGNDVNDLHDFFCGEFFGWVTEDIMGQVKKKPRRSTTRNEKGERDVLSTVEMAGFYDFVQMRAAQAGFDVPDPDPEWGLHHERSAA